MNFLTLLAFYCCVEIVSNNNLTISLSLEDTLVRHRTIIQPLVHQLMNKYITHLLINLLTHVLHDILIH
jgi:hypothetical protein